MNFRSLRTLLFAGVAVLALASAAHAQTHVTNQTEIVAGYNTATWTTPAFTQIAAGNTIIGEIQSSVSGTNLTSITDNASGNTYTIGSAVQFNNYGVWYIPFTGVNIQGTPTTLTFHFSAVDQGGGTVFDVFSNAVVNVAPTTTWLSTPTTTPSVNVTPTLSPSVLWGFLNPQAVGTVSNGGGSWAFGVNDSTDNYYTEYKSTTGTTSQAIPFTNTGSGDNYMISAVLSAAGTGAINSVSLSKSTFTPNTANAVVGTLSDSHTGTGTPAFSISGTNSCGFHLSGNQVQAQAGGCAPGVYNDWTVTDTISGFTNSPFTWCATGGGCKQGGLSVEAQAVASITPVLTSSDKFQASKADALVGTALVTAMNPTTPAPAGALSITPSNASTTGTGTSGNNFFTVASATGILFGQTVTGTGVPANSIVTNVVGTTVTISNNLSGNLSATSLTFTGNSCGFHLNGSQVLAKSSGGCAAAIYNDWNVVFTPTNTDIPTFTVAEGAQAVGSLQLALTSDGSTVAAKLLPEVDGNCVMGAQGAPTYAPCPSQGPVGPAGPTGATGPAGQNAGQTGVFTPVNSSMACTQGQSGFGPGHTDTTHMYIYVCDAANQWTYFGPSAALGASIP